MNLYKLRLIREALLKAELREIEYLDQFPAVSMTFDDEYDARIKELMKAEAAKKHGTSRKLKRVIVAAAIVAVISLTATACAVIKPIREIFEVVFEEFTQIFIGDGEEKTLSEIYLPTWVPEGYEQTEFERKLLIADTVWSKNSEKIYLTQTALNAQSVFIDTEDGKYKVLTIGDTTVYYINKNNTYDLIWYTEDYLFSIFCPSTVSLDDLEKMISSMSVSEQDSLPEH